MILFGFTLDLACFTVLGVIALKVVDRVHTFYPPREMALVVSFHWLNLFILLKLKFCRKMDLHFCTLQTL